MSFYRTYRPQVIDEIDNASVREQLFSLLTKDRKELPHAYFFTGPKGTGKTTAARVIAKLFNCTKLTKSGPCGTCEFCQSISNGTNLDVIEMDAASNRGIDEIRQLRERIGFTPVSSAYTIYIIDEVHMLTTEAFNALLKTLEEPPAHVVFVLATTDAHKVPATIKSRCLELNFHRASLAELLHALERVVKSEKINISQDGLICIAGLADGSFRDAVKLLEQASLQEGKITEESLQKVFSTPKYSNLSAFMKLLSTRDAKASLAYLEEIHQQGFDLKAFIIFMLQALEADLVNTVKGTTDPKFGTLRELQEAIRVFTRAYEEMRYSPIPQLPIELAIIEFCQATLVQQITVSDKKQPDDVEPVTHVANNPAPQSLGLLTYEKLIEHWSDFIAATKPYNHSVAGVLRSSRPKSVENGIVLIEAFYKFHQEKLANVSTKQVLSEVLKKLFGEKVTIEIVLGKK